MSGLGEILSGSGMLSEKAFFITNVLWGRPYREAFLRYCLPSLLWPRNLAALSRTRRNVLLIITTTEDWAAITADPVFQRVIGHYDIEYLPLPECEGGKFGRCAAGYRIAIERLAGENAIALHLSPDLIVADGCLDALHDSQERGASVVIIPAWRTALEAFESLLTQDEARGNEPMGGRRLAELCAQAVHDFESDRFWDGSTFRDDVGSLWWAVPGARGWIMHALSGVPYIDQQRISDHDPRPLGKLPFDAYQSMFYPSGGPVVVPSDSDDVFIASFTPAQEEGRGRTPTRWQYRSRLTRPLARGLAFRMHVRAMTGRGRNQVGLRALSQPFFVHPDPITPAWQACAELASWTVGRFVGDLLPNPKPPGALSRTGGVLLDLLAFIILPSAAFSRLSRRMDAAAKLFVGALRGDSEARYLVRRRFGWYRR